MASARSGTPVGQTWRSRARRPFLEITRATIATATEENSVISAPVRLSATVAVPAESRRGGGLVVEPGDAVGHELGEKGVEVDKVPVQHALGDPRLGGERPAGQAVRPVSEQDSLSSLEELFAGVAKGYPRRHRASPSLGSAPLDRRSSLPAPGPTCSMSASALASRPGSSKELGAGARIDPDARMAVRAGQHGFEVEVAKIEDWAPAGRRFEAVVAGQAWHWVDPVVGAAKAAGVLRPRGRLVVFWNCFQLPSQLGEAFAAFPRVLPGSPFSRGMSGEVETYSVQVAKASEGMREVQSFGEPEQWRFDCSRAYTREEWLDQVPTFGGHSWFPAGNLDELLEGIGSAVDAVGGSFTMSYATLVLTAARTTDTP